MMQAIGLTGCENENQAIVAAQLLDRITQRGMRVSVCIGIVDAEHAHVIHSGNGEVWRVGADASRGHLDAHLDRTIDTAGEFYQLIQRVDQALDLFLGKVRVAGLPVVPAVPQDLLRECHLSGQMSAAQSVGHFTGERKSE